jgi:hypothetical protein
VGAVCCQDSQRKNEMVVLVTYTSRSLKVFTGLILSVASRQEETVVYRNIVYLYT